MLEEGYKMRRRKKVSGATVNRELALLKHMFNLAIDWDLYLSANPVRKVKFFREFTIASRVLSQDEEERLLRYAAPFMQDLIVFGLHTGCVSEKCFRFVGPTWIWRKTF